MKKTIVAIILAAVSAFAAYAQLPSVKIEDTKGNVFDTGKLADGKTPMIISFWAMTCKNCIKELDAISDAFPDWKEEAEFKVVAVSTDDSRFTTKARSFAQGRGWSDFTLLYDKNQDFVRAMNVTATPHVFVTDGAGKIVYSHTGYTPGSESELIEAILELAGKHE